MEIIKNLSSKHRQRGSRNVPDETEVTDEEQVRYER